MRTHHVQVQGCLPTLLVLLLIGALLAAAITTSAVFLAAAAVLAVGAGVIRRVREMWKGGVRPAPPAARRAADVTLDAEVIEPPAEGRDPPPRLG